MTGGAGFIGSNLVDVLTGRGDDVIVLDNLATGYADNVVSPARLVVGDVTDEAAVSECVAGAEVVFHLAAARSVARSVEAPVETDRVNTGGTLTVLECARRAGVRRVVTTSSSSVYGGAAAVPTREDAPLSPRTPYAVSRWAETPRFPTALLSPLPTATEEHRQPDTGMPAGIVTSRGSRSEMRQHRKGVALAGYGERDRPSKSQGARPTARAAFAGC